MNPSSSNGFQLGNKPTSKPPTWELGTNPNQNYSSQELETIQVAFPLENQLVPSSNGAVSTSNNSDAILRIIDQFLMEDELEPHLMLVESSAFREKERYFYEALVHKKPPSPPQQESPYLHVAKLVDDASNTDEVTIVKISHSELAMDNNYVPIQEFDDSVWMYTIDEKLTADMANMQILGKNMVRTRGAKIRTKKRNIEENDEVVDLRALLVDCSKSVSSGDRVTANDLLRQIRQHSSPHGDGNQRLAHYFANGLEARLSGTAGSKIRGIPNSSDYLRVYRLSNASSPMRKILSFASNEMIAIKSEKATRIHIIDFGILYGIQWPSFIRRVAGREGEPPKKLRITGIEFPQVVEIIEDTGRRLACYAEALGVPFEYKAIAREWETIRIEDLKIDKDEFVVVVCSVRSMRLLDETVRVGESPRSMFLKLVRGINPDIFVHAILNGAFNQPFFGYRFRDLLLHYLAVFDMLDTLIPNRYLPERVMVERDLIGKDILNVIACEGPERVERPETYRQWQVRDVKAGFVKVPFERRLIDAITCKVGNLYHKEFSVFEEDHWMMISWKGRAIRAISCWQPA